MLEFAAKLAVPVRLPENVLVKVVPSNVKLGLSVIVLPAPAKTTRPDVNLQP